MDTKKSKKMSNQNNSKNTGNGLRRTRRITRGPQNQRSSVRIHRTEFWFEESNAGLGSKTFDRENFPSWFRKYSNLYESYKMHSFRIRWNSGYSAFSGGWIYASFNTNKSQSKENFTLQTICAQQNAARSKLANNGVLNIPASSWLAQPSRRQCSGENSYLLDFRYYIDNQGTVNPGKIAFFVEYDVSFHTPQINQEDVQEETKLVFSPGQQPFINISKDIYFEDSITKWTYKIPFRYYGILSWMLPFNQGTASGKTYTLAKLGFKLNGTSYQAPLIYKTTSQSSNGTYYLDAAGSIPIHIWAYNGALNQAITGQQAISQTTQSNSGNYLNISICFHSDNPDDDDEIEIEVDKSGCPGGLIQYRNLESLPDFNTTSVVPV